MAQISPVPIREVPEQPPDTTPTATKVIFWAIVAFLVFKALK